jgi:hypothetical protein
MKKIMVLVLVLSSSILFGYYPFKWYFEGGTFGTQTVWSQCTPCLYVKLDTLHLIAEYS